MQHLYLRTMEESRAHPGKIAWLLTVGDTPTLDGPTRMFAGYTKIQDERLITPQMVLWDAEQAYDDWQRKVSAINLTLW